MKDVFLGEDGLFPAPKEISFNCSCPDWAVMCKHVAAALYGVGARLDEDPWNWCSASTASPPAPKLWARCCLWEKKPFWFAKSELPFI